jgi:ribosomal protein S18 acetylase RimI-like enzyme
VIGTGTAKAHRGPGSTVSDTNIENGGDMYLDIRDCSILRLRASDLKAVMAINEQSFLRPWQSSQVEQYLLDADKFGLAVQNFSWIVGFALCQIQSDQLYVSLLATDCRSRNGGVGTMLVRALQQELKRLNKPRLELHVYSKDEIPVHLYAKTGFRQCEEIPDFYPDGVSAVRMVWEDGSTSAASLVAVR